VVVSTAPAEPGIFAASPSVGGGFRRVWVRRRRQHGTRTSMQRVLCILYALGLLASQWPQVHEGPIVA
jgi:hypothetical protein